MSDTPLILYIPGLKPKPQPDVHREQLWRCLLAGLRNADPSVAGSVEASSHSFGIVSWTYDFYREHRDIDLDRQSIDALLEKTRADNSDIAEASAWQRRLLRAIYRIGDRLPFLIPKLADENMELHLRDIRRYVRNTDDGAATARRHLKMPLRAAAKAGRPVLLIAHSMGSVIAWDVLWELSREGDYDGRVDLFMTIGSPLGQRYIQRRLHGAKLAGAERYPDVIRHWINIAAIGELTALDRTLSDDFGEMQRLGLLQSIDDIEVFNWFRIDGVLNVHAEYGYLANSEVAAQIANWWKSHQRN
ncbi:MAG: hypothetical protein U5K38_06205 [Woeseiaceae bacterium]|nr:hypothetical protein [Woeseiaceae bacterium]